MTIWPKGKDYLPSSEMVNLMNQSWEVKTITMSIFNFISSYDGTKLTLDKAGIAKERGWSLND